MKKRWDYDLEVETEEAIHSIDGLLRLATAAEQAGRFDECFAYLNRAVPSAAGKLQLGRFYLNHGHELGNMTYEQSLRKAEQLLLSIQEESKAACKLLSEIYISNKRSVAALLLAIKADNQETIRRCRMKLSENICIQELESEPHASYLLACNLLNRGTCSASIEYLLQIASSTGDGMVMLALAQFYETKNEVKLARDYYWLAAELGCPELLTKA